MRPRCAPVCLCLALAGAAQFFGANRVKAADPPARTLVATDLSQVDEDFVLQGEYYGQLAGELNGPWTTYGLQIVARGDGNFIASEFLGGLPGHGWFGGPRRVLSGQKGVDPLTLTGDGRRYMIINGGARLVDEWGQFIGSILKVHRISSTMGLLPPPEAKIIFDGRNTDELVNATISPEGTLEQGAWTLDPVRDYYLHLEFQLSYMPYARGQGRSNSGVYLQQRYEVQILDSFGLTGEDNECGALYRYRRPDVNMCLPPLQWQTFDIQFRSPRFDRTGKKMENGHAIVWHNGFAVQPRIELLRPTGHGQPETPQLLPILLQNHGNPVRFRNLWMVDSPTIVVKPALAGSGLNGAGTVGAAAIGTSVYGWGVPVVAPWGRPVESP